MIYPPELQKTIAAGKYAVIPTDTIYGIVCTALNEGAVEGIYRIKKRNTEKPLIVLIADLNQLELFQIPWQRYSQTLSRYWPGPVSIILPCQSEVFRYLHRGTNTIAFRFPATAALQELLRTTGPIVAPSANPEQLPPATTIEEAKQYFGEAVDCYVDGGEIHAAPSTLIQVGEDGSITKLR